MRDFVKIVFSFLLLGLLMGCVDKSPQIPYNKLPKDTEKEDLLSMNIEFQNFECEEIRHYIDSLNLKMDTTLSGLYYRIDEVGYGDTVAKFDEVTIRYSLTLLDGTTCDALRNVVKVVQLGKGNTIKGLEEAVRMLKVSGSGTFIIPSYLAYGVSGKNGCIPPWNPVFCKVCLIEKN